VAEAVTQIRDVVELEIAIGAGIGGQLLAGNSSGTLVDFAGQFSQNGLTYGG